MLDFDGEAVPPSWCLQCGDPIPPGSRTMCDDCYGYLHVGDIDEEEDPWPDDPDD